LQGANTPKKVVDRNEDDKASKFQNGQQLSTRFPHLLETEAIENRRFLPGTGIRLGRRGSGVQIAPPRPNLLCFQGYFRQTAHLPKVQGAGEPAIGNVGVIEPSSRLSGN